MTNYVTLKEGDPIQTWYWECDKCGEYGHSNPEDLEVEEEAEWHANICGSKYIE
jgi:hypothetical protein